MKAYKPKILVLDIENTPILAHVWTMHEAEVLKVERHSYLLSFAFQWYPDKQIHVRSLRKYGGYDPQKHDDKALVQELWGLLDKADIVVGQNSNDFDLKVANTRFLFHSLDIPSPYGKVDTLKINRAVFKHPSNKLDEVAQYHGIGRKLPHTGKNLWFGCMAGNEKDWRLMEKYNAHDVYLTRKLYDLVLPWARPAQHPNLNILTGENACSSCGSRNLQARGWWVSTGGASEYQRLKCIDCGHWNRGPLQKFGNKIQVKSLQT